MIKGGKQVQDKELLKHVAVQLYKYQDFKAAVWKDKINVNGYSPATLQTYYSGMRSFLSTGKIDTNRAPRLFYDYIQECVSTHYAKLTPSEKDRVRTYVYTKGRSSKVRKFKDESITPVTSTNKIEIKEETLEAIKNTPERVKTVGLLLKDGEDTIIRVFENADVLKGFKQAFKYMDKSNELTFTEVDVTYSIRMA